MKISVEIKTKGNGKFCSKQCHFFRSLIVWDFCDLFGDLKRVEDKKKVQFISYRHPECVEAAR